MLQELRIDKHREAIIRAEAQLAARRCALAETTDPGRRDELRGCVRTIETMLPVYRQMERYMAVVLDVPEAD